MLVSKVLHLFYAQIMRPLIEIYFFYQDAKGWITRMMFGEMLSDEVVRDSDGNIFCVFLLYQKYDIPNNTLHVMKKLSQAGVQIVVVSNLKLGGGRRSNLPLLSIG